MMTKQQAKDNLEQGRTLLVNNTWYYTKDYMTCRNDNCCEEHFSNIEQCLEYLEDDLGLAEVLK